VIGGALDVDGENLVGKREDTRAVARAVHAGSWETEGEKAVIIVIQVS